MKAHQLISALEEARYGNRRLREDTAPVAAAPSHAPTGAGTWKTPSAATNKDEGSRTGGEKDAIKKKDSALPTPVAKSPSHAPTSTSQWKTTGGFGGSSDDEGEAISKEAVKENILRRLMNTDGTDIEAIMAEAEISEGGHKTGCKCAFCCNKGKFGKKKDNESDDDNEDKEKVSEGHMPMHRQNHSFKRNIGGGSRMNFRQRSPAPRPKAYSLPGGAMTGNQPAMERLFTSDNVSQAVQEAADELLESPNE